MWTSPDRYYLLAEGPELPKLKRLLGESKWSVSPEASTCSPAARGLP